MPSLQSVPPNRTVGVVLMIYATQFTMLEQGNAGAVFVKKSLILLTFYHKYDIIENRVLHIRGSVAITQFFGGFAVILPCAIVTL